jgi:hypothetical protein
MQDYKCGEIPASTIDYIGEQFGVQDLSKMADQNILRGDIDGTIRC